MAVSSRMVWEIEMPGENPTVSIIKFDKRTDRLPTLSSVPSRIRNKAVNRRALYHILGRGDQNIEEVSYRNGW